MFTATDVDVSAVGLVVGFVLAVGIFFLGNWASEQVEDRGWLRVIGAVVAVAVFLILGFNVYES